MTIILKKALQGRLLMDVVNGTTELNSFLRSPENQQGVHEVLFQLGDQQSLLRINRDANLVSYLDKFDRPMSGNLRQAIESALPDTQIFDVSRAKRFENIDNPQGLSATLNLDPQAPDWQAHASTILANAKAPEVSIPKVEAPVQAASSRLRFWQKGTPAVAPVNSPDNTEITTRKPGAKN